MRTTMAALVTLLTLVGLVAAPADARADDPDELVPYIVGGSPSPPSTWPAMVALVSSDGSDGLRQFCGGTLVRPDLVVTAAHCAEVNDFYLDPTGLSVLAGRTDLSHGGGELIAVSSVTLHPSWNRVSLSGDLALLHLAHDAQQQVAPFVDRDVEPHWATEPAATIVGWGGTTTQGTSSSVLLQRSVEVLSDDACATRFSSYYQAGFDLCAGGVGYGTCHGDSGGPLYATDRSGVQSLVGVISRGVKDCGTAPGVMTRLAAYADWVRETTMSDATDRIAGTDRYATAAALSSRMAPGVGVVYLASGESFPDAVTSAAVAPAAGGPVLLTSRDALPAATRAELVRLRPQRLVIVGGTGAISADVMSDAAVAAGVAATRLSGPNRYSTAVEISRDAFPAGAGVAYVTVGTAFADAVASGPIAGAADGGPVLLTETGSLGVDVVDELRRLDPDRIVVLGGTSAVGAGVEAQLEGIAPVERIRGADRYATSVALSAATFAPGIDVVYLATGRSFPDALTSGPAAVADGAPVLLIDGRHIPPSVAAEILRLQPEHLVVLGGTSAIPLATMWDLDRLLQ
ncbi:MAG: cell wall-binding repeat-containing protein [Acidimicrobiia bacterium]|nr:cell wall-binding repeat-containing protein [Acidimicrobiia bacterium]